MNKKSPLVIGSTVLLWVLLISAFYSRLSQIVTNQHGALTQGITTVIVLWLVLSAFVACYHAISFVVSLFEIRFGKERERVYGSTPPTAILCPCCNDLKEDAVSSFVKQDYPSYRVFLLDDSTEPIEQNRVDAIAARHSNVQVIRRDGRSGFKAGNINNALKVIGAQFKYFGVADSDEILPDNFLRETVAFCEADAKLGFVQAAHEQYGQTDFAKKTGDGIDLHWKYFLPARNNHGFVYFYGHGALIRTADCLQVGGFPEIVAEDVGLAVRLRASGYTGFYANKIICKEEVPPTYIAWRKRHGKVIRGTLEFLQKEFPRFALSKKVSIWEKADLLIASSLLFMPIPFLLFVFLLHLGMPFLNPDNYSLNFPWGFQAGYIKTAMGIFKPLWGWSGLLFTLFFVFAPLVYLLPGLIKRPLHVIAYLFNGCAINLSGMLNACVETFSWLWTRKAVFSVTANKNEGKNSRKRLALELSISLLLVGCAVLTGSFCLFAVALSLCMVPFFIKGDLSGGIRPYIALVPMALTLLVFASVPFALVGVTGAFAGIVLAHH